MNKWKRRGREWRERNESLWDFWHQTSDRLVEALNNVEELRRQIELLKKRDTTALRREKENHQWGCDLVEEKNVLREKVDELRRDNVKLATGLARVQGECEGTQAQVLKHSATIVNLRERENEALKESEGLLAWQRRARKWRKRAYGWAGTCGRAVRTRDERVEALLTWQRAVREAWNAYDAEFEVEASTLDALREAIEAEPIDGEK